MFKHSEEVTQETIDFYESLIEPPYVESRYEIPYSSEMMEGLFGAAPREGRPSELGSVHERGGGLLPIRDQVTPGDPTDPLACLMDDGDALPAGTDPEELVLVCRRLLRKLDAQSAAILRMRFGIGRDAMTQQEVAERLGVSRATVGRIEQRLLTELRGQGHDQQVGRAA